MSAVLIIISVLCVVLLVVLGVCLRLLRLLTRAARSQEIEGPPGPVGQDGVRGPEGKRGKRGKRGQDAARIVDVVHEDGVWSFHFSDQSIIYVNDRKIEPSGSPVEGGRTAVSSTEARLVIYNPKPGRDPLSCGCHQRPLTPGQKILWWPNEDGTAVIFCDQSEQYKQFARAARDLAGASQ